MASDDRFQRKVSSSFPVTVKLCQDYQLKSLGGSKPQQRVQASISPLWQIGPAKRNESRDTSLCLSHHFTQSPNLPQLTYAVSLDYRLTSNI